MRYSDDIIEEVRQKNDIVDVVSQYVKLTRKGSSYFGLCPFHNEKTPLWAETEAITASFTETTLIIDEESLQKFLCWHEALPTKKYIQTLEQLCMNQAEICKLSLEVIELQKRDLQHQQRTIALLEKRQAMATEQNRLNQQVITMVSDTLSKTEDGWMERLWRRISNKQKL